MRFHKEDSRIRVTPQTPEDLWHLEKIIKPGDKVTGRTLRKYAPEGGQVERKKIIVTIEVEQVSFHPGFEKLRVLGVILSGKPEEFISIGAHQSIDIGMNDSITIEKIKWAKHELDRLREAAEKTKSPKAFVLVLYEREAELFVVREFGVSSLGTVDLTGAGKYSEQAKEQKTKNYLEIIKLLENNNVEKLIIAGPGFEKESFYKFMKEKKPSIRAFVESTGNTGRQAVTELMKKNALSRITAQMRLVEETKAIDEFVEKLAKENATYGIDKVREALDYGAVEKLIVLDSMLSDKRVEELLDKAEKTRASIMIISKENEENQKIKALGGVVATLRFKVG